jgi:hypothetical protein
MLIPLMVRQAHHERNQNQPPMKSTLTVRPELVEGLFRDS